MTLAKNPATSFDWPRQASAGPEYQGFARLRPREWQVLDLLATGATNAEIARRLQLAEGTIRNVVARVTIKLGVVDRTQAALLALRAGLGAERKLSVPCSANGSSGP